MDWLSVGHYDTIHEELQQIRAENSGQWFLKSKEFIRWADGTGPNSLICTGFRMNLDRIRILIVQPERENQYSCDILLMCSYGLIDRSIAIDYIKERFINENTNVLHIYFDFKAQQSQSAIDISSILLKQLLSNGDNIPHDVEDLYERCTRTGTRPDQTTLTLLLTSWSQKSSSIYAVFDALDECSDRHQEEILSLFGLLEQSGYKLLISSRPHLQHLSDHLNRIQTINICADDSDLKNYIMARLASQRIHNPILTIKCLGLIEGVQGM
jgi:hypothetical protein